MKTIVIYKSISGFTKKYAEWIAEELQADLLTHNKVSIKTLLPYDTIIFGGSLHAVGITGVQLIKKNLDILKNKHIIIFTTGASPVRNTIAAEILGMNFSVEQQKLIRFYYFRGGFDFNKLDIPNKLLMTLLKWKLKRKQHRTPDERGMLAAYSMPMDFTKKENILELVIYVRGLQDR